MLLWSAGTMPSVDHITTGNASENGHGGINCWEHIVSPWKVEYWFSFIVYVNFELSLVEAFASFTLSNVFKLA